MTSQAPPKAVYRVIDAYDHPHGGRILRLRLGTGEALSLKELKGGTMIATSEEGDEIRVKVDGFALFGGRLSDARLARSGRADICVTGDAVQAIRAGWRVAGPA